MLPLALTNNTMAEAKEFPPQKVRAIAAEVVALLKERNETVSVAETVQIALLSMYHGYVKSGPCANSAVP